MSERPLARAALTVGLGNVGSRVLGLVRELVIAALFGATAPTDAFRAAFRVPLALYDLTVGGMVSSALVPTFAGYLAQGDEAALRRAANAVGALLVAVLLAACVAAAALAGPMMEALAAGYDAAVRAESAGLLRAMTPALLLMGLSGLFSALLYAQDRFLPSALALTCFNAGVVVAALLLHPALGVGSLAAGVVAGAALQAGVQWWALRRWFTVVRVALRHPAVRQVLSLYAPVALGLVVSTAAIAIDTNLASRTGEGSLAALGFATTLVQLPLGLVATGVSTAALPRLARAAGSTGDAMVYKRSLAEGLRMVLLAILPATAGLVVLREPVVRLLFERGAFDAEATARTAVAFLAYAPGLPAAALDQVLVNGYYARRNTRTPVLVGVAAVGVYLAAALALLGPLGMAGLALANSLQWLAHLAMMAWLTHRALGGLAGLGLGSTALRAAVGSGALAAAVGAGAAAVGADTARGLPALTAAVALLGLLGACSYLGVLAVIGRAELQLLAGALRRRQ